MMQADGSVRAGGAASAPIRFGAWQVPNWIAERQLPHGFYRCRCSQRRRSGLLWQFRKGFTNISSQPLDFSRIDLGLKISNFDALESSQPRTEQNEVGPKKRRRIDCDSSDAEAVSREQRTSGDHPELPEVLEHKLPESIHWEAVRTTNAAERLRPQGRWHHRPQPATAPPIWQSMTCT